MDPVLDQEASWGVIIEQRRALVDLLAGLSPDQWETTSLCTEWRVRDVAAHLSMVSNSPSVGFFVRQGVAAGGNFHKLNQRSAAAHAARAVEVIVADLRDHADSRKVPVVSSPKNVLFDLLIHIQDITRPLGVDWPLDPTAARTGAQRLWSMGWPFHARRLVDGFRLVATDTDWAVGEGLDVRGPVGAHLLALSGRPAAMRDLSGPGADELADRLAPATPSHRGPRLTSGRRVPAP